MGDAYGQLAELTRKAGIDVAIILGSGMGQVGNRCTTQCSLSLSELPKMCDASVDGHTGMVRLGRWANKQVLLFEGRLHFYEGHSWEMVARPVRIAQELGAKILLITNAAGGIRDDLTPGTLMALNNHLKLTNRLSWQDCLSRTAGKSPYSCRLNDLLMDAGTIISTGIYAAVTGPCYETPAEIRALRVMGVDAVGMSTAHEIEVAHELGMECAGISCVTNRAAGLARGPITHEEVLAVANAQGGRLRALIENFLGKLGSTRLG